MNLTRRQVPCLRLAAPCDSGYAGLSLIALVEEEVHFRVAPAPVRVRQPLPRTVERHIRLRQRREHARRDVTRWLDESGEAQVRYVFRIQECLLRSEEHTSELQS